MGVSTEKTKGDLNQIIWLDHVKSILENNKDLDDAERKLLTHLAGKPNLPKKKAKFTNFAKKIRNIDESVIESVWNLFDEVLKKLREEKQIANNEEYKKKQPKKRIMDSDESGSNTECKKAKVLKKNQHDVCKNVTKKPPGQPGAKNGSKKRKSGKSSADPTKVTKSK